MLLESRPMGSSTRGYLADFDMHVAGTLPALEFGRAVTGRNTSGASNTLDPVHTSSVKAPSDLVELQISLGFFPFSDGVPGRGMDHATSLRFWEGEFRVLFLKLSGVSGSDMLRRQDKT